MQEMAAHIRMIEMNRIIEEESRI